MRRTLLLSLLAVTALSGTAIPASAATVREFEGTVVSVDRDARTFRLQDDETDRIRTIKVTSRTRYQRVRFSTLKAGLRNIEATVRRVDGRWVASTVEVSGKDRANDDD
jgi:hypothetical protein